MVEQDKLFLLDASPDPEGQDVAGSFDLSGLIERINYAIRKYKARRVAIDSITAVFQQYDAVSVVRREIFRLIARLKEIGVTTVMTTERIDEYGPIARYGVEEFVSDNVVILRNVLRVSAQGTVEILKLRGMTDVKGEPSRQLPRHQCLPAGGNALDPAQPNVRSAQVSLASMRCVVADSSGLDHPGDRCHCTGKTLLVSKFVEMPARERAILFAYEESRAQCCATPVGASILKKESQLLKIICAYPESTGLEDHLQIIKTEISQFKPSRMAIDSLSALARGVSHNAFRQFVIGVTGYAKQEEIAGFFTNTSEEFMGSHSITDSHISTITDTILLLQYVEIRGEMARALNVFKMRGSWHDKGIREFIITINGPDIKDSVSNFERIISGVPHRINQDERSEFSRIVKGVGEDQPDPAPDCCCAARPGAAAPCRRHPRGGGQTRRWCPR